MVASDEFFYLVDKYRVAHFFAGKHMYKKANIVLKKLLSSNESKLCATVSILNSDFF